MRLGLIISQRCNAQCAHCYSSCGPQQTTQLPRERLLSLMDEAAALASDDDLNFSISGGEPFLDLPLLLELIEHGSALGAWMSCVSNGYWASTDSKSRKLLTELRGAGLDALDISYSRFHAPFVPRTRVQRALTIARELGLTATLKYVAANSDLPDDRAIVDWAQAASIDDVQHFDLLPAVRDGATIPDSEFPRTPGLPEGRCPGALISVREDGKAYGCCTPGAHTPWLALGNVHSESLAAIHSRFRDSDRLRALRAKGPAFLARAIQADGLGHRLRHSYANACDMCTHIATDSALRESADRAICERELSQLNSLLDSLVES